MDKGCQFGIIVLILLGREGVGEGKRYDSHVFMTHANIYDFLHFIFIARILNVLYLKEQSACSCFSLL